MSRIPRLKRKPGFLVACLICLPRKNPICVQHSDPMSRRSLKVDRAINELLDSTPQAGSIYSPGTLRAFAIRTGLIQLADLATCGAHSRRAALAIALENHRSPRRSALRAVKDDGWPHRLRVSDRK